MVNVVIPMAGKSLFFKEEAYQFPKPLIEIQGQTMIQHVIENLSQIKEPIKFTFIVTSADCSKYHIDNVLQLLTDNNCSIVRLEKETRGAACSCLMAIDSIDNNDKLVISNCDQILENKLNEAMQYFDKNDFDAGVICFQSVHPRWSFAKADDDGTVLETAEKRPVSKNAIAGFYYFKNGALFVQGAMQSINKDANVNGAYYISPVMNEVILQGFRVGMYSIPNEFYHTFYSPQKIDEYEKHIASLDNK